MVSPGHNELISGINNYITVKMKGGNTEIFLIDNND